MEKDLQANRTLPTKRQPRKQREVFWQCGPMMPVLKLLILLQSSPVAGDADTTLDTPSRFQEMNSLAWQFPSDLGIYN